MAVIALHQGGWRVLEFMPEGVTVTSSVQVFCNAHSQK